LERRRHPHTALQRRGWTPRGRRPLRPRGRRANWWCSRDAGRRFRRSAGNRRGIGDLGKALHGRLYWGGAAPLPRKALAVVSSFLTDSPPGVVIGRAQRDGARSASVRAVDGWRCVDDLGHRPCIFTTKIGLDWSRGRHLDTALDSGTGRRVAISGKPASNLYLIGWAVPLNPSLQSAARAARRAALSPSGERRRGSRRSSGEESSSGAGAGLREDGPVPSGTNEILGRSRRSSVSEWNILLNLDGLL